MKGQWDKKQSDSLCDAKEKFPRQAETNGSSDQSTEPATTSKRRNARSSGCLWGQFQDGQGQKGVAIKIDLFDLLESFVLYVLPFPK